MSRYCPVCGGEFTDKIATCPNDNTLLEKTASKQTLSGLKRIYAAKNQIEMERIANILEEKGIFVYDHKTGISQIPVPSDLHFVIEVPADQEKKAREIIKLAIKDEVISNLGRFL